MIDRSKRRLFRQRHSEPGNLPWLKNPHQFSDQCSRCGECVSACETNIIVNGDGGFPTIDFSKDECTFCYKCAKACPEGLFEDQQQSPWSKVAHIGDGCLAKQGVDCRVCEESCEPFAIRFKPQLGSVAQPHIECDECNGCGACVSSCPSNAIYVGDIPVNTL